MLKKLTFLLLAAIFCPPWPGLPLQTALAAEQPAGRQHLVFFRNTPQELEVYKIQGREPGPTVMLLGGIHGDEPGAYLSADAYADLTPRRGSLIIIPRANFRAVLHGQRGPGGDMNRKFGEINPGDPENQVVSVLKSLMAESDLLLTLHDGSGFYRPKHESDQAGPHRYGQCIIADSARYTHPQSGKTLELEREALAAIAKVNASIADPLHKFHFFNMETAGEESLYKEHRNSATYFALTRLGRPAFCIETSKNLPGLGEKIRQHNLVINAFLEIYGLELETPGPTQAAAPDFSHLVILLASSSADPLPLALSNGQTLLVNPGDSIKVLHAAASSQRGLLVTLEDNFTSISQRPLRVENPITLAVRRDSRTLGRVHIGLNPQNGPPRVTGQPTGTQAAFAPPGRDANPKALPGRRLIAALEKAEAQAAANHGQIAGFLVEVDGQPLEIAPNQEFAILHGSRLKLLDIRAQGGPLPPNTVMNLKGFISKQNEARNTGEDRGATANIPVDMLRGHSLNGQGEVYAINAEQGKKILASCSVRLVPPLLESVTLRLDGQTKILRPGSRTHIAPGAQIELLAVTLQNGHKLSSPRYTLGGHPCPDTLPQTLTMRDIAINLAIFNHNTLAGKITLVPRRTE